MRLISLALIFAGLAFAQLDDNTITVTSAQNVAVVPDQVSVSISLDVESTATLDDVLKVLQPAGTTSGDLLNVNTYGDLTNVNTYNGQFSLNTWTFVTVAPVARLNQTIAALQKIQSSLKTQYVKRALTFYVTPQTSPQPQQCSFAALIADARMRARAWADAAGVGLGPVVSAGDLAGVGQTALIVWPRAISALIFDPLGGVVTFPALTASYWAYPQLAASSVNAFNSCSLTVQFKLIR